VINCTTVRVCYYLNDISALNENENANV